MTKKLIKKGTAVLLTLAILICSSGMSVFAIEQEGTSQKSYEVYNGYGELIHVADSLEEAESYIPNANCDTRSSGAALLAAKTAIKKAVPIVVGACVLYKTYKWTQGEAELIDILDVIVPVKTLQEIVAERSQLNLYATANGTNPYPPHSYQGATWIRSSFYYIVTK